MVVASVPRGEAPIAPKAEVNVKQALDMASQEVQNGGPRRNAADDRVQAERVALRVCNHVQGVIREMPSAHVATPQRDERQALATPR
jgi:hypothetical protein